MVNMKHIRRFFDGVDSNGVPESASAYALCEHSLRCLEVLVKHVLDLLKIEKTRSYTAKNYELHRLLKTGCNSVVGAKLFLVINNIVEPESIRNQV